MAASKVTLPYNERCKGASASAGNNPDHLAGKLPDLVYGQAKKLQEKGEKNFWGACGARRSLVEKEPESVMNLLKVDAYT